MPSTCVFQFDRLEPIYYGGETINGRIILETSKDKDVNEIAINFTGEAKIRWTETNRRHGEKVTTEFKGQETYIYSHTTLQRGDQLPAGKHEYTFVITLPIDLPSSCLGEHGHISYEMSLVINRRLRLDNVFRQPMTILTQFDLNLSPELSLPIQKEVRKNICFWTCCCSGPSTATLSIPFGGYAPGQSIQYQIEINNMTRRYIVEAIELCLRQHFSFTVETPYKKSRSTIVNLDKANIEEPVEGGSHRVLEGNLVIPSTPPSSQSTHIISISYDILMVVKSGGCYKDVELIVPIVIGTVPILLRDSNLEDISMTTPGTSTSNHNVNQTPNLSPPSYEEVMNFEPHFIDTDINELNRVKDYFPRYPMYKNFALPTAPNNEDNPEIDSSLLPSTSIRC